jgi:hypothetical protein
MSVGVCGHLLPCATQLSGAQQRIPRIAEVVRIAPDGFIGPLTIQDHLDAVVRREAHQLVADDGRERMHRLVLKAEHRAQVVPEAVRARVQFDRLRARLRECVVHVPALVELLRKIREGAEFPGGTLLGPHARRGADDRRRVESAREIHAHRHVAAHVHAHGVLEEFGEVRGRISGIALLCDRGQRPVARLAQRAVARDPERVAGRNLSDSLEERGDGLVQFVLVEERGSGRAIEARRVETGGEDALDLGRHDGGPALRVHEQRLDAPAVARTEDGAVATIVDRERPHAVQALHACGPPLHVGMKEHLGIARRPEDMPTGPKLVAQFDEVVDLAVEHDRENAIGRQHRLMPRGRKIEDRQATEPHAHAPVLLEAAVVGAAMHDRFGHAARDGRRFLGRVVTDQAGEAAHGNPESMVGWWESRCRLSAMRECARRRRAHGARRRATSDRGRYR